MTAYEIILIFIGILALLISFGSLIVALLAFLYVQHTTVSRLFQQSYCLLILILKAAQTIGLCDFS